MNIRQVGRLGRLLAIWRARELGQDPRHLFDEPPSSPSSPHPSSSSSSTSSTAAATSPHPSSSAVASSSSSSSTDPSSPDGLSTSPPTPAARRRRHSDPQQRLGSLLEFWQNLERAAQEQEAREAAAARAPTPQLVRRARRKSLVPDAQETRRVVWSAGSSGGGRERDDDSLDLVAAVQRRKSALTARQQAKLRHGASVPELLRAHTQAQAAAAAPSSSATTTPSTSRDSIVGDMPTFPSSSDTPPPGNPSLARVATDEVYSREAAGGSGIMPPTLRRLKTDMEDRHSPSPTPASPVVVTTSVAENEHVSPLQADRHRRLSASTGIVSDASKPEHLPTRVSVSGQGATRPSLSRLRTDHADPDASPSPPPIEPLRVELMDAPDSDADGDESPVIDPRLAALSISKFATSGLATRTRNPSRWRRRRRGSARRDDLNASASLMVLPGSIMARGMPGSMSVPGSPTHMTHEGAAEMLMGMVAGELEAGRVAGAEEMNLAEESESDFSTTETGDDDDGDDSELMSELNIPDEAAMDPEALAAMKEQRGMIIDEVIETERLYVASLQSLIDRYVHPLKTRQDLGVTQEQVMVMFGNVEILANFHHVMLADLEGGAMHIPAVFLKYADFLKMYTAYLNGYNQALATINSLRKNKKFKAFLKQARGSDGLNLMGYLIKPVQRIPRYELLLREIAKCTPEGHEEFETLQEAQNKIQTIAEHINEEKRHVENMSKLVEIQNRIKGDFDSLIQPDRRLIHEGVLTKHSDGLFKTKSKRHFILFNDMLLWTDDSADYRGHIFLRGAHVMPMQDNHRGLLINSSSTKSPEIKVECKSPKEREHWLELLRGCLRKLKRRRGRMHRFHARSTAHGARDKVHQLIAESLKNFKDG